MLKTAIARREITPLESVPLFGYGDRTHDSTGIHDPLSVYAWWLESDGQAPFAWVVLDLCVIGIGAAGALARDAAALSAIDGLTGERLLVSTTHTHSGPDTLAIDTDGRPWAPAYYRLLVERTAQALIEARDRARACTIEVREARGSLGVNRRNPRMPVDPRIVILSLVGEDGRLQGALFHYSCHLTVLGVDNYLVSADWAGPVRRSLEAELGVPVAYLQGAEGNIDPLTRGFLDMSDPDQAHGSSFEVLSELAEGVCSALRAGLRSAPALRLKSARLLAWEQELPLRYGALSPEAVRGRIEEWKSEFAELLGVTAAEVPEGRNINALVKERCRSLGLPREEVRRLVASQFAYGNFLVSYAGGREAVQPRQGTARLPCRILDFGGLCVLCAPLEILVEAAFDWQRGLADRIALLAGLTGGWLGYMPHRVNFEEAEAGERYETVSTVFSPTACETMLDEAGRALSIARTTPPAGRGRLP
jgi:PAS domain-containing protein